MKESSAYRPRIVDARLTHLLKAFGGVEITGPKWCGKTWTATHQAASVDSLAEYSTREAALVDPALVLSGEEPHLIDEWQEVPQIWDAVRNHIDASGNRKGQLILTGSTQPRDLNLIRHSGTGRIAHLSMYPMTISESTEGAGGVSFSALFDGKFTPQRYSTNLFQISRLVCRGGWPSTITLEDDFALETPIEYLNNVTNVTIPKVGKSANTALAILRALALNTGQPVRSTTLIKDLAESSVSRPTLDSYIDLFQSLYLIENLPSWAPQLRAKTKALARPKTYFVDPSLPAALLSAHPDALIKNTQTLGILFETLVLRDLRVFLSAISGVGNRIGYYRDAQGAEIDFVVQLGNGQWAGIETKLSDIAVTPAAATKLKKTAAKITDNLLTQVQAPTFLAFIVGKGDFAYQRDDGIYVIPAAMLEA